MQSSGPEPSALTYQIILKILVEAVCFLKFFYFFTKLIYIDPLNNYPGHAIGRATFLVFRKESAYIN